jgi:putative Ig domain-containing protein
MAWKDAGACSPGAVFCAFVFLFCVLPSHGAESWTIRGTPAKSVVAGDVYSFCPGANVKGPPARYFAIQNKPAWASFDTKSGLLRGRPTSSQTGTYSNVRISVTDGKKSLALPAFSITVQKGATTPTTSPKPTTPPKVLSFSLSWLPPTENEDGTALTNLAHYRIYRGTAPGKLQLVSTASAGLTRLVMDAPPPGKHYFAITAVNKNGHESEQSPLISGIFN